MEEIYSWLTALVLVIPRILTIFTILPFLGSKILPNLVRNALVISFGLILTPLIKHQLSLLANPSDINLIFIIFKEIILGLIIGYLFSLIFWAVSSVGILIDTQRGANNAQVFDPAANEETTPMSIFFNQVMVTIIFASGGFLYLLAAIYDSYLFWPVLSFSPSINLSAASFFLNQFDLMMRLILLLAAPAIIVMLISELSLALASRYLPQLNVFTLAMPLKSLMAILIISLYIVFMFEYLDDIFAKSIVTMLTDLHILFQ